MYKGNKIENVMLVAPFFPINMMMKRLLFILLLEFTLFHTAAPLSLWSTKRSTASAVTPPLFSRKRMNLPLSSSNNDYDVGGGDAEYRSIADVVGGLHGGKYQFDGGASSSYLDSSLFSGQGDCSSSQNKEEEEDNDEIPNWAKQMQKQLPTVVTTQPLKVPSNADPMDGMVYSATVTIKNDERTWEKFYAKVIYCDEAGNISSTDVDGCDGNSNDKMMAPMYIVKPKNGHLAPRGGASNACDETNPYSDSVNLRVIHDSNAISSSNRLGQYWLVAGTEEEKWYYQLELKD